ncbi:MAG: NUDIX domain-containing protein [Defluviitaleaceae bacterium]|nr:NUDIX domain-containing protein [Defluviitaleaceae bacterium]
MAHTNDKTQRCEIWDVLNEDSTPRGYTKERGTLVEGEYHLVVRSWIVQANGDFLVSKRSGSKPWPLLWETPGGAALAGEESLTAAIREVYEEIGVALDPKNAHFFKRQSKPRPNSTSGGAVFDDWIFYQNVKLYDTYLDFSEVCDIMYASEDKIKEMIAEKKFLSYEFCPHLDGIFEFVKTKR